MADSIFIVNLRRTLARLYPDERSMRRIIDDTGLNESHIPLGGNAINNWHAILYEAINTDKVDALRKVTLSESEYGESAELVNAWAKYLNPIDVPIPIPHRRVNMNIVVSILLAIFIAATFIPNIGPTIVRRITHALIPKQIVNSTSATLSENVNPTVQPTPLLSAQVEATRTNPVDGATYVWIQPGEFSMGSSITDTLAITNEKPQHKVVLDGFWIMQTEVTNAQYKHCVEAKVCEPTKSAHMNNPLYMNHPVVNVTWNQAKTYADWVGGRLPTETEWEKACRGTDGRIYPWGNQAPTTQLLNYLGSNKKDTMSVGSYPSGANGLFDMAGNVLEWTASWYDQNYYANLPGYNSKQPDNRIYRTLRGGSFYDSEDVVRCAARNWDLPNIEVDYLGFRLVSSGF